MISQVAQEKPVRVQTVQEQDGDCAHHPALRRQVAVPGTRGHERRDENVYQAQRCFCPLEFFFSRCGKMGQAGCQARIYIYPLKAADVPFLVLSGSRGHFVARCVCTRMSSPEVAIARTPQYPSIPLSLASAQYSIPSSTKTYKH